MRCLALLVLVVPLLPPPADAQEPEHPQTFDVSAWDIRAAESRVESYRGRSALLLRDGAAWLRGSRFKDGTIEFDIAFGNATGFPGIAFRAATRHDFELVYLREQLSGQPHATQYTPVLHDLYAWQIYAGPRWEAAAQWTYERWMHVRLVVSGSRAELFVDGDSAVQVIPSLRGPDGVGEIGLVAGPGAARFANIVVRPHDDAGAAAMAPAPRDSTSATIVRSWRVSRPFPESLLARSTELDVGSSGVGTGPWTVLDVEERGIANLARLAGVADGRNTVIASVTLTADHAMTARLRFGFSDRVRVYLNGRLLYAGNDGFGTRDPDFLGIVGLFDELFLPLRKGSNELWFAVSETFGGWAITADLPERAGLAVRQTP